MADKKGFPEFEFKLPNFDMAFWDKFKVPGVDTMALMQSQKKNFDALVKANQKAAEGYQNLMRRQSEILTETMQSIQEAAGELMKANAGRELPKKQAELVEKAIGRALKYMKELADMAVSANADSFKVMQDRAKESIVEMRELAEKLTTRGK